LQNRRFTLSENKTAHQHNSLASISKAGLQ